MNTIKLLFGIVLLSTLAACSSKPSQFYVLNPMPAKKNIRKNLQLVVGPVSLAPYLAIPQIVTRITERQLYLDEYHRWAEPLSANITRVLIDDLKSILRTQYVFSYPKPSSVSNRYRVKVDIERFDTNLQGQSVLIANWQLINVRTNRMTQSNTIKITTDVPIPLNYNDVVSAMNLNLQKFSYAVGRTI